MKIPQRRPGLAQLASRWVFVVALVAACGGSATTMWTPDDGGTGGAGHGKDASVGASGHSGGVGTGGSSIGPDGGTIVGPGEMFPGNGAVGNAPSGAACTSATDCQSVSCTGGACAATCVSDGAACTASDACCSGNCNAGLCQPLNTQCKTGGNACADNSACCSQLCSNGTCVLGSSFCIQSGDACKVGTDCCGGICNITGGALLGTCGAAPSGPSFCNGGIDGTVCSGCNTCCSRLCAPYAPTGVFVCQPANGCRIDGDLCRKDSDCCGAAGSGLPGDGNVVCDIAQGQVIGICRNPTGCNPEGNVCHYKNYACSISSARDDCCGAPGNSGACQLDALGVPRCHAIGTCRGPNEACAFTGDCCNGAPCIPDGKGGRICTPPPPTGGPACSPEGGKCTITADCCRGYLCISELGSSEGVCGIVAVPPPDAGSPPPVDSGAGGAAGSGGSPGYDAGPLPCAAYGQSCATSSDCCNGTVCDQGLCLVPIR
jgi:hypothetical protein